MEIDCGFQAVDFGGLVVDSGGFRLIAVFRQTVLISRVTTCLENLEMSGNLTAVRDFTKSQALLFDLISILF